MGRDSMFTCPNCGVIIVRDKVYMTLLQAKNDANIINQKDLIDDICPECSHIVIKKSCLK